MNKKRIPFIAFIVLVAVASSCLLMYVERDKQKSDLSNSREPNIIITGAVFIETNKEGNVNYIIRSPKILYFNHTNSFVFQKPNITIKTSNNPFYVVANKGFSRDGVDIVYLKGDVKMRRSERNDLESTITTQAAIVNLKKGYITTDKLVTLKRPDLTVQALGAKVYLNKKIIKLLSSIKESYVPNKN